MMEAELTKEQEENFNLIRDSNYKIVLQTKLDKKPELEVLKVYSMCTADLFVAEGKKDLILLDKDSSDVEFHKQDKYWAAIKVTAPEEIRKLLPEETKGLTREDIKNIISGKNKEIEKSKKEQIIEGNKLIERIDGCEKYPLYIGLEKRKSVPELEAAGVKTGQEDSLDQRPYLLAGTVESFINHNYQAEEVKILAPIQLADELFGYQRNKPKLIGLDKEEITKYKNFREIKATKEKLENPESEAFCRQTTARKYGTIANKEPSNLDFAVICNGARIRTLISKEAGDTSTYLDPKSIFLISFSGRRFQELFGNLEALLEKYDGNKTAPTILNNVPMAY